MSESTCLIHAFAYGSGTPNEAKEGNPIHALGESISFGRFASESLSWEKWSSFSQNRYVEEAEKYAKPGSVAQKKAFFEAHYKRIAAQKAAAAAEAAAAAALLEQERSNAQLEADDIVDIIDSLSAHGSDTPFSTPHGNIEEQQDVKSPDTASTSNPCIQVDKLSLCEVKEDGYHVKSDSSGHFERVDSHDQNTKLEIDERSEMEKPLLKDKFELTSIKKPAPRASKIHCSPDRYKATAANTTRMGNIATPLSRNVAIDHSDTKRFTPRLNHLSTPAKEFERLILPEVKSVKRSNGVASFVKSYSCLTPSNSKVSVSKNSSRTPQSENKRTRTPVHPSASGSKTIGPKWRFLAMDSFSKTLSTCRNKSSPSPNISSPFNLRTEERAARRKEKLEEKFNEKVVRKVQLQTKVKERAESELKKLRQSLCFKARPLPEFYKERKPLNDPIQMMPIPWPQSESPNPGRKHSTSIARDAIPPLIPATQKNSGAHVLPVKNIQKTQHRHKRHSSLAEMIMHENTPPNIVF